MRPVTWMKEMLDSNKRVIAAGILAASAVLLIVASILLVLNSGGGNDAATQDGVLVMEVSVPQALSLSDGAHASLDNGASLAVSGDKASLRFQGRYLEGIDLPLLVPPGQHLVSFSDPDTGISLEQSGTGQRVLSFLLPSEEGGMPMAISATVESIKTQDSHVSISLGQMEGRIEFIPGIPQGSESPQILKVGLDIELRRLPKDASLTVSRLAELNPVTSAAVASTTDADGPPWAITLALEVRRTNLDNGEDVGEAVLSLLIPNTNTGLATEAAVVHVDDEGDARLLALKHVITSAVQHLKFLSPGGLSTFVVLTRPSAPQPTPTSTAVATTVPTLTPSALPSPTRSPTPPPTMTPAPGLTSTPTPTAIPVPTPTSSTTPIAPETATPTATASPSSTATSSPAPTTTPSPVPTPTASETPIPPPASAPRPTRTPTPTPVPEPDPHYAVTVHTTDTTKLKWFLDTLGTEWYLDYRDNVNNIPAGHQKPIVYLNLPGPSLERIQELAVQAPGSVWYIVGEPNRRGANYNATTIVAQLHDIYEAIKDPVNGDPTARITSPSVLNWDFTCIGCGGFQSGQDWVAEFITAYQTTYGTEPPVDIWAIDVYPLVWDTLPTVDHQLVIDQINGMRSYLNTTSEQSGKPIWITEMGLHWGWDQMLWPGDAGYDPSCDPNPQPSGTYQTGQVIGYYTAIFDWLDANAVSKNIEKWFPLITYWNVNTCNDSADAGSTFFDGPNIGANLTAVGQFFRDRVYDISP